MKRPLYPFPGMEMMQDMALLLILCRFPNLCMYVYICIYTDQNILYLYIYIHTSMYSDESLRNVLSGELRVPTYIVI